MMRNCSYDSRKLSPKRVKMIMRSVDGVHRIERSAVVKMSQSLIEFCLKITKEAAMLKNHAGRSTLQREDVEMAKRRLL